MRKLVSCLCFAMASAAGPALADSNDDVLRCAAIKADGERLACFDTLAVALARTTGERRAAAEVRAKEDFGLTESQKDEKYPEDPDRVSESDITIVSTVEAVAEVAHGPTYVTLANGQQWRTPTSGGFVRPPKPGMEVTIRKGGLDGYRLTVTGRPGAVAVRRVK